MSFNAEKALLEGFNAVEFIIVDMTEFLDCFRDLRDIASIISLFQIFPSFCCRKILDLVLDRRNDVENN